MHKKTGCIFYFYMYNNFLSVFCWRNPGYSSERIPHF